MLSQPNDLAEVDFLGLSIKCLVSGALLLILLIVSPATVAADLGETVTCYLLTEPVTIDGAWTSKTEWNDAEEVKMLVGDGNADGYFRVKFDDNWLYVLAESLINTSVEYNSAKGFGDYYSVFLDTAHNHGKSPSTDDYRFYANWRSTGNTELKLGKGNGTGWDWSSTPPEGTQVSIGLDTGNSPHTPHPHVVGEFRLPLSIIQIGTFGFFIRFGDSTEALNMHFYWPGPTMANQAIDPSSWGNVSINNNPIPEFSSVWLIMLTMVTVVLVIFRRNRRRQTA